MASKKNAFLVKNGWVDGWMGGRTHSGERSLKALFGCARKGRNQLQDNPADSTLRIDNEH